MKKKDDRGWPPMIPTCWGREKTSVWGRERGKRRERGMRKEDVFATPEIAHYSNKIMINYNNYKNSQHLRDNYKLFNDSS